MELPGLTSKDTGGERVREFGAETFGEDIFKHLLLLLGNDGLKRFRSQYQLVIAINSHAAEI